MTEINGKDVFKENFENVMNSVSSDSESDDGFSRIDVIAEVLKERGYVVNWNEVVGGWIIQDL